MTRASADNRAGRQPRRRFDAAELAYLTGERRLGRLATADAGGRPHVVPVGWAYNGELGTIDISGRSFSATRKFRNAEENGQAAFVVDDVLPPWRPRAVMVQGVAEPIGGDAAGGGEALIRLWPDHIVSWGLG